MPFKGNFYKNNLALWFLGRKDVDKFTLLLRPFQWKLTACKVGIYYKYNFMLLKKGLKIIFVEGGKANLTIGALRVDPLIFSGNFKIKESGCTFSTVNIRTFRGKKNSLSINCKIRYVFIHACVKNVLYKLLPRIFSLWVLLKRFVICFQRNCNAM